jgi:type IV pilus assembly protein PilC
MAEFVIRLTDERGHVTEQVESGTTESEIRERLLQRGALVVGVRPRGTLGGSWAFGGTRKVKLAQFTVFNQQLLTLVRAGLPILNALDLLSRQQKHAAFRKTLSRLRDRVKAGELLSQACESEGVFPKMYTSTLVAGEKSGGLEEVLSRYVRFQRQALFFRKKLKASLVYPSLLMTMVMVMTTFLVTFVVPQFAALYSQLGAQLPAPTQFILAVGVNARLYFPVIVATLFALAVGGWRWKRTESGARLIDRLRLQAPLLGPIWLKYQVSTFSRMTATLLSGGLPLVSALQTAGSSMQSPELAAAVAGATQKVREGNALAHSLESSGRFPALAVEMIEVGESTGALSQMLTSVAEFYEEDVETALAAALALMEPVTLIVMALVVGSVLISLYLPIFRLGSGLMS